MDFSILGFLICAQMILQVNEIAAFSSGGEKGERENNT